MTTQFKWLDFKITNRCNNQCVYCGGNNDPPSASELLSFPVIKSTLLDAVDANFTHLSFLGGEPSIRKDICDIINVVANIKDLNLLLITNLKEFNLKMYKSLFQTKSISAEIVASFENFSFPNYKRVDPSVSLERILKIKKLAKKYNTTRKRAISLHSVISRENFYKIGQFVKYFYRKGIQISLGLVCPSIFTETPSAFNEFRKNEISMIIDQLNNLEVLGMLNYANQVLRDFLEIYTFGQFSHKDDCRAGKKQVIINSDGEVFPCISESYLSDKHYGNIKSERFSLILKKLENFQCSMTPNSACWDHFLWDNLANKLEKEGLNEA